MEITERARLGIVAMFLLCSTVLCKQLRSGTIRVGTNAREKMTFLYPVVVDIGNMCDNGIGPSLLSLFNFAHGYFQNPFTARSLVWRE